MAVITSVKERAKPSIQLVYHLLVKLLAIVAVLHRSDAHLAVYPNREGFVACCVIPLNKQFVTFALNNIAVSNLGIQELNTDMVALTIAGLPTHVCPCCCWQALLPLVLCDRYPLRSCIVLVGVNKSFSTG